MQTRLAVAGAGGAAVRSVPFHVPRKAVAPPRACDPVAHAAASNACDACLGPGGRANAGSPSSPHPTRRLLPPRPPTTPHPTPQDDCAAACVATDGCASFQWCGYGSFNGTCAWPDAAKAQPAKGDCVLGAGGWRQAASSQTVGGWTVWTGCAPVDAPPPVAPVADDEAAVAVPPPRAPRAAPADEPAPVAPAPLLAPVAVVPDAPKPAGWAAVQPAAVVAPLTDVVTPVRTPAPAPRAPAAALAVAPPTAASTGAALTKAAAAPAPAAAATKGSPPAPAKKDLSTTTPLAAPGGKHLAGTVLEMQPGLAAPECEALCAADKACRGWSLCTAAAGCGPVGANVCELKTWAVGAKAAHMADGEGWVSGVKGGGVAAAKSVGA